MNQQLPPTNNSYLPMNNLQTETLGNISPTNKTKDNGTKDETTKSSQSSVLNLLHTTQGYPGPNSNNENLGFGGENAMFLTNFFFKQKNTKYKDMFGDKQNSENKDDKPEDFFWQFFWNAFQNPNWKSLWGSTRKWRTTCIIWTTWRARW